MASEKAQKAANEAKAALDEAEKALNRAKDAMELELQIIQEREKEAKKREGVLQQSLEQAKKEVEKTKKESKLEIERQQEMLCKAVEDVQRMQKMIADLEAKCEKKPEIPEDYECPLTFALMVDPVINENGELFALTYVCTMCEAFIHNNQETRSRELRL